MKKILFALLLVTLSSAKTVFASETIITEENKLKFIEMKTDQPRAEAKYTVTKTDGNGVYEFNQSYNGDFDRFTDITQTIKTAMRDNNGTVETDNSTIIIKDKQGRALEKVTRGFDHAKEQIIYKKFDGQGKLLKQKKYKIKGPVCDSTSFITMARVYAINRGRPGYDRFYLLSNEPSMYDVQVKDLGVVDFTKPSGEKIKAIKIQTIPDFGIMTGVMAKLVPPTFFWYNADEPHGFLQYEGLEVGIGGAVVRITAE